jgi:hypothetical protein
MKPKRGRLKCGEVLVSMRAASVKNVPEPQLDLIRTCILEEKQKNKRSREREKKCTRGQSRGQEWSAPVPPTIVVQQRDFLENMERIIFKVRRKR